jgi:hypothetical protein
MWENISQDLLSAAARNPAMLEGKVRSYLRYVSECESKVAEKALPLFGRHCAILTHCYSGCR